MIIVRQATDGDISACLEVSVSRKDAFFQERDFLRALKDEDAIYLVAEADGKVVGYIMGYVNPTKNDEVMIQSTMVHADYRNRGVGSMLVKSLADRAFNRGVKHVYAEVEDGPDRFYARCGFRKEYEWHSMRLSKKR